MLHPQKRGPLGGFTCLHAGTRSIRLETRGALTVIVDGEAGEEARASVPYPDHGYGGHEFVLSPDERWLVMFLFSGQSESGYEVFEFRPALRHAGGLPYVRGDGTGVAVSADVVALPATINASLKLEDYELDDDGRTVDQEDVPWMIVRVQTLPDGPIATCRIDVVVPSGTPFERDDCYYPEALRFVSPDEVAFTAWDEEVRIRLPLPESMTIAGPF